MQYFKWPVRNEDPELIFCFCSSSLFGVLPSFGYQPLPSILDICVEVSTYLYYIYSLHSSRQWIQIQIENFVNLRATYLSSIVGTAVMSLHILAKFYCSLCSMKCINSSRIYVIFKWNFWFCKEPSQMWNLIKTPLLHYVFNSWRPVKKYEQNRFRPRDIVFLFQKFVFPVRTACIIHNATRPPMDADVIVLC